MISDAADVAALNARNMFTHRDTHFLRSHGLIHAIYITTV